MTRVLNLGFDRGNERTNAALLTDTGNLMEFDASSMVSTGNMRKYNALKSGSNSTGDKELMVEYDGTVYFLDDFALQGQHPTTDFSDMDRYSKTHTKVSIMCFVAQAATKMWANPSASDISVNLVMGVPLNAYLEKRQDIMDALTNSYRYAFNGRDFDIHVDSVRVFMEGAGAAVYHGLDRTATIGVVDSGSLTTNILRFDGQKAITEQCESYDIGVNSALDKLSIKFEDEYGRSLEDREKQLVLRASIGQGIYPTLYAGDRASNGTLLHEWMRKSIEETGEEKNAKISGKWRNGAGKVAFGFKQILHVGGGAYYFHPSLQRIIKKAEQAIDPEKANARGYAVLADEIGQRRALKRA